ncbi:hypothetical protein B0H15DRAFT_953274 [Mycena belliarum]|uniref:Uncharacterized protein n=1 Tax=Mycena belliarum TaxID=1033014 RepID=A0AAD6TVK7_9AGAR|nr:hypothetical protein B0H15DRAFT_953274 [Mycena belliae]
MADIALDSFTLPQAAPDHASRFRPPALSSVAPSRLAAAPARRVRPLHAAHASSTLATPSLQVGGGVVRPLCPRCHIKQTPYHPPSPGCFPDLTLPLSHTPGAQIRRSCAHASRERAPSLRGAQIRAKHNSSRHVCGAVLAAAALSRRIAAALCRIISVSLRYARLDVVLPSLGGVPHAGSAPASSPAPAPVLRLPPRAPRHATH